MLKELLASILMIASNYFQADGLFKVNTDFSYKNDTVQIKDTLSKVKNKFAHVVLLYGQSNAEGASRVEYLNKNSKSKFTQYNTGFNNVYINYCNTINNSNNEFVKCKLGCGYDKSFFGPEMGIAEIMSKAYPKDSTFIIKWTVGGSILRSQWLDNHNNRGDLYNESVDFTTKCLDYLKYKGYSFEINGVCWMQGEGDSYINDSKAYFKDTVAYSSLLRHDLEKYQPHIRFVDAGINEDKNMWLYPKQINEGKKKFASMSSINYFIDTNKLGIITRKEPYGNPDFAHYDSMSMVKLGQEFGKMLIKK